MLSKTKGIVLLKNNKKQDHLAYNVLDLKSQIRKAGYHSIYI